MSFEEGHTPDPVQNGVPVISGKVPTPFGVLLEMARYPDTDLLWPDSGGRE